MKMSEAAKYMLIGAWVMAIVLFMGVGLAADRPLRYPTASDQKLDAHMSQTIASLNDYWQPYLAQWGVHDRPPYDLPWGDRGKCSNVVDAQNAFYCRGDHMPSGYIELPHDFLSQRWRSTVGAGQVDFVVAHEYGHFVTYRVGDNMSRAPFMAARQSQFDRPFGVNVELIADCLAGVWLDYRYGHKTEKVINAATAWLRQDAPESDSHGSAAMRYAAIVRGARGSANDCLTASWWGIRPRG